MLVHDTQASRHGSENVQRVGHLWTEANRKLRAAGGGVACRAALYREESVVVVQETARGAVPEVHHEQQVRLRLRAAHADTCECVGCGRRALPTAGRKRRAYMPWTIRTFLCFGVVMSTSSRCMSSNT